MIYQPQINPNNQLLASRLRASHQSEGRRALISFYFVLSRYPLILIHSFTYILLLVNDPHLFAF
jgi:hypothetical protein